MKIINLIIAVFLTIGMSLETNPATAENRVTIIEMPESGQTVEFPMRPREIDSENAENARQAVMLQARLNGPEERLKAIEMGESGQTVVFPMNPNEITFEDAERARLAAHSKAISHSTGKPAKSFELAESGIIIDFISQRPEMYAENR